MQPIYVWSEVTALKSKRNHMTTVNHRRVQCIVQVFCMVLCEVVKKLPMRTQRQTTSTDCHLKTGENQNCGEMAMAERLLKIDGSLIKLSQRSAYGLFCMILFKRQAFKKIKLLFQEKQLTFLDSVLSGLLPARSLNQASMAFFVLAVAGQKLSLGFICCRFRPVSGKVLISSFFVRMALKNAPTYM